MAGTIGKKPDGYPIGKQTLTLEQEIADLYIEPLSSEVLEASQTLRALSFDDHLLRRFGQLDFIQRKPSEIETLTLRSVADELWVLVSGKVLCLCRDLRAGSPSENVEVRFEISAPSRVLIPFGVAFGWQAVDHPAQMLRCSTHQDHEHPEDRVIHIGNTS